MLVANVSKEHICKFYIQFIEYMKSKNWIVDVACRMDEPIRECNTAYDLPCDRNPFRGEIRKSVSVVSVEQAQRDIVKFEVFSVVEEEERIIKSYLKI